MGMLDRRVGFGNGDVMPLLGQVASETFRRAEMRRVE